MYKRTLIDFYNKNQGTFREQEILWYPKMGTTIKSLTPNPKEFKRNCAIFALMSINTSLNINIKKFKHYIATGEFKGLFPQKFHQLQKANTTEEMLLALKGNKIKNFFMNLYDPVNPQYVTIDRWAYKAAGYYGNPTNKKYLEVANAYKQSAKDLGLLPNQLQAITWSKIRGSHA